MANAAMGNIVFRWFRTARALRQWGRSGPFGSGRDAVRRAAADREARFLNVLDRLVYGNPRSPYLALLRNAGCEFADVRREVAQRGLEGALRRLSDAGVCVTHDEMKGRAVARRGQAEFLFRPEDFDGAPAEHQLTTGTSGSTGRSTRVRICLEHYAGQLAHTQASHEIHQLTQAVHALWLPPAEWGLSRLLLTSGLGAPPRLWQSQVPLRPPAVPLSMVAKMTALTCLLRSAGTAAPFMGFTPLGRPGPLGLWLARRLRNGRRVQLATYPSSAVRLACWAARHGVDLAGCTFLVAGEPITSARRHAIESSGTACIPLFGASETGAAAEACLAPAGADDMHLYAHRFALISTPRHVGTALDVDALQLTTLTPTSPKVFLNAETGDAGVVEERDCGCPWGALGCRTHLRDVRSFAKLAAEGMTLPGDAVFRVLEEALPARFGGRAGDYQLTTRPRRSGLTDYLLIVSPVVGTCNEAAVRATFLDELVRTGGASRLMADYLRRAGQMEVVRRVPDVSAGGKSLPVLLHPASQGGRARPSAS